MASDDSLLGYISEQHQVAGVQRTDRVPETVPALLAVRDEIRQRQLDFDRSKLAHSEEDPEVEE